MGRSADPVPPPPPPKPKDTTSKQQKKEKDTPYSQEANEQAGASGSGQRWSWLAPLERLAPDPEMLYFSALGSQTTLRASFEHAFDAQAPALPTTSARDPAFEITCKAGDKGSPKTWPAWYRNLVLAAVSYSTLVVIMASTAYGAGIPGLKQDFHLTNSTTPVLGISTYLLGLALGPLCLAPLSEMYGRRPVYTAAMLVFAVMLLPSALAPDFATLLATRFVAALAGSVMVANAGGTLSDMAASPETRARYFAVWTLGVANGPALGPVLGNVVYQYLGWRWIHWVMLILAVVAWIAMACVEETFSPAILLQRSKTLRRADGRYWSRFETRQVSLGRRLWTSMKRPVAMIITEPICLFWDVYIALLYAILYLCVVAYPIVFRDLRGWEPAVAGLPFLAISLGVLLAILAEPLLGRISKLVHLLQQIGQRRAAAAAASADSTSHGTPTPPPSPQHQHQQDSTLQPSPESANIPLILLGSILIPLGQLPFALSAAPPNSPAIAILSGIPFGCGMTIVFVYVSNYLAACYGGQGAQQGFAASALAGNAALRNVVGAGLPLLAPVLYARLGSLPTGLVLTGLEVLLVAVPVFFWRFGPRMRERSRMATRVE